jgi:hypothetical protein
MASKCSRLGFDRREFLGAGGLFLGGLDVARGAAPTVLPSPVKAVWDLGLAWRDRTPTRGAEKGTGYFYVQKYAGPFSALEPFVTIKCCTGEPTHV